MDLVLLGLIAMAMLLVLLLTIYLIDRVNSIERSTMEAVKGLSGAQAATATPSGPFGSLSGRALWDTMTSETTAMDAIEDSMLRQRYEPVLTRHLEGLFEDGRRDGQAGKFQTPQSARRINTARGSVESWLPSNVSQLVYQCGQDFATQGPAQWASVRQTLDDAVRDLFGKARLELRSRLSDTLMGPDPDAAAPATPSLPAPAPASLPR
jgi:hypothetical protein